MTAVRATPEQMVQRETELRCWIDKGYTVLEAGRLMGLTRNQVEHLAQTRKIKCLHGALSEAKSDAAIKGNQVRWGGVCSTTTVRP